MDDKKNISTKIYDTASRLTKRAETIIKIGEYKLEVKLIEKDIEKRKQYLGDLIYKWYKNDEIIIADIIKICKEIGGLENNKFSIDKKISSLKELVEEG